MVDVLVVCEGQTEREFCNAIVAPYLGRHEVSLAGKLVGKPGRRQGGIAAWEKYRNDVIRLGKESARRHVAVLVDYYRLPDSWPGRVPSRTLPVAQRGVAVEKALIDDLKNEFPGRFHPCVQLHEFETLLFVDTAKAGLSLAFAENRLDRENVIASELASIRQNCGGSVEAIDDSPETAPSKRILNVVRGYDKVAWGNDVVKDVGLDALRVDCPWLDRWLKKLETLGGHAHG